MNIIARTSEHSLSIHNGDILLDINNNREYSVVYINVKNNSIIVCQRNISRLDMTLLNLDTVKQYVLEQTYMVTEPKQFVLDKMSMSESAQKSNETRERIIKEIADKYGPDFSAFLKKKTYDAFLRYELPEKYDVSYVTIYKLLRLYLQSGCDITSVYDKRAFGNSRIKEHYTEKTGKKPDLSPQGIIITDEVKAIFDKMLDYYASGRSKSYKFVYNLMIAEYFSDQREIDGGVQYTAFPITERPTYNQFYYYAQKKITADKMGEIKTSRMEYRNNMRLLRSDVQKAAIGPGYITEMDELESDLELVDSKTRTMDIGRAVVYCLIDVCTRLIMAVSVSLENNSVRGFTNCFMFLADDKRKTANRYGLDFDETMWPSGYLPKIIRSDRGTEYMSNEVGRICNELGITLEPVPPGTGSLKPVVEQSFHQLHCSINPVTEKHGLITKRKDSGHHKQARLTMQEFTKIVLQCAVAHNTSTIENFKLTAQQTKDQVYPIPVVLWKYGCEHGLEPKRIINKEQFAWTLMTKESGKISRNGITANGINYLPVDDIDLEHRMAAAGTKTVPFECRMDRRIVDKLYYLKDNKLRYCEINMSSTDNAEYAGLMLEDAMALRKARKLLVAESKRATAETDFFTAMSTKQTVDDAVRATNKALREQSDGNKPTVDDSNIKKNRASERRRTMSDHYIETHLLEDKEPRKETDSQTSLPVVADTSETDEFDAFFSEEEIDWKKAIKDERKEE